MRRLAIILYRIEIVCAVRLAAFGDFWAASAARRLGKFSATIPGSD